LNSISLDFPDVFVCTVTRQQNIAGWRDLQFEIIFKVVFSSVVSVVLIEGNVNVSGRVMIHPLFSGSQQIISKFDKGYPSTIMRRPYISKRLPEAQAFILFNCTL
jgi:hypothetical protein